MASRLATQRFLILPIVILALAQGPAGAANNANLIGSNASTPAPGTAGSITTSTTSANVLRSVAEDITGQVLPGGVSLVLNASMSPHCPLACTHYFAGASASSPFVAQVLPSGIGNLAASVRVSCYPPYGVGAPYTEDWNVCYQSIDNASGPIPGRKTSAAICQELMDDLASTDVDKLASSGVMGIRSTSETKVGRWMKAKGDIGCGWGVTMSGGLGGPSVDTSSWTLEDWVSNKGFQIKKWQASVATERDCCEYAMSFEGSPWKEGGSAVRFQFKSGTCRVDRETMMRGNLDRSSGLAMRDTEVCGDGALYWRHATGAADAANLKGNTLCQANNGFKVLKSSDASAYSPFGSLPDHFTNQWGNELPNHECSKWPYGHCKGVIGYNSIASPEECCNACVNLNWIDSSIDGDRSMKLGPTGDMVFTNPCVAWQVVGGKCRIMREEMVRDYPSFQGQTVRQAIESGPSCSQDTQGTSIWDSERHCNYYSFAHYRETFEVTPPVNATVPSSNLTNATFSKVVLFDFLNKFGGSQAMLDAASLDGTTEILDIHASIRSLVGTGESSRSISIQNDGLSVWLSSREVNVDNTTCAKLRLYGSADMTTFQDGSTSLQNPSTAPWCETDACVSTGGELSLECNMTEFLLKIIEDPGSHSTAGAGEPHARLLEDVADAVALSFDGDGTGKDNIVFEHVTVGRRTVKGSQLNLPSIPGTTGATPPVSATITNSAQMRVLVLAMACVMFCY